MQPKEDKKPAVTEQFKISQETAEEQFQQLVDHYDIVAEDFGERESNGQIAFNSLKRKIVKGIRLGKVQVSYDEENGLTVTQETINGHKFEYKEVGSAVKVNLEKKRIKGNHEELYSLLAMLSKSGPKFFEKLRPADLTIAESLGAVFLRA